MPREVKCSTWKGEPFRYAHAKRDGIWLELVKDARGVVSCWTRQPRDVTKKLAWHPVYVEFVAKAPSSTVLYCELWVEGAGRDAVKGAMRDQLPALRIECFAVERYDSNSAPASIELQQCESLANACGVMFTPYLDDVQDGDVPHYEDKDGDIPLDQLEEFQRRLLLDHAFANTEGWVLKDGNLLNWRKLKAVETYDLMIAGFTDGRGKYEGMVGALVLESKNGVRVKCSGMTDEERRSMTDSFWQYQGKIVEVACQGRGSAGGLAHPRFVRVREDKTEADEL